jgi:hypothetical protein
MKTSLNLMCLPYLASNPVMLVIDIPGKEINKVIGVIFV